MTTTCPAKNLQIEAAGALRCRYLARIPHGHTLEDVLMPEYFGQLQSPKQLCAGDVIEVEWEDFSMFGELQVLAQSPSTGQLILRIRKDFVDLSEVEIPKGWSVQWTGVEGKYAIERGNFKESGHASKQAAIVRICHIDEQERTKRETKKSVASMNVSKTKEAA